MQKNVRHQTIWNADRVAAMYPPVSSDMAVDVAIVGGGITGVTTAYLLKQAGLRVALITDGRIGSGTTGSTTAHLCSLPDLELDQLQDKFGADPARVTLEATSSAIHLIQTLAANMTPEVQFHRVSAYKYTENPEDVARLEQEAKVALSLGLKCRLLERADLPFKTLAALQIEDQAMFHPLHYLDELTKQIPGQGSAVFENSHVEHIEDGTPSVVNCNGYHVQAHSVVLNTHSPIGVYLSLHTRVAPYMSYVVAFEGEEIETAGLYFDTSKPYFYLRPLSLNNRRVWIVGGCDHKTGQRENTEDAFDRLEDFVRARFQNPRFLYRWSNELFESVDGLPYIGRIPFTTNLFTGTGFAGVGMSFGTLAAMINSDLVLNRPNQYAHLFSPSRVKPFASAARFTQENANVVRWFVGDRLSASDLKTVDDIPKGEGQVLSLGTKRFAVYRDDHGFLHVFSPVCSHMGGIVHWNKAEQTWDCPLHGGRYRCTGEVFEGPPLQDLTPEMLHQAQPPGTLFVQPETLGEIPLQP